TRHRLLSAGFVFLLSALAMFSKEDGVIVIGAVVIVIFYEQQLTRFGSGFLIIALLLLLGVYFWLRNQSGAEAIRFVEGGGYSFHPSFGILFDNLRLYI